MPAGFGLLSPLVFGCLRPRQPILGSELAGDVDAVGKAVTAFRIGDPVVAFAEARMGCHAELRCMPARGTVALKPAALTYDEAAALPFGGLTALHFLRKERRGRTGRSSIAPIPWSRSSRRTGTSTPAARRAAWSSPSVRRGRADPGISRARHRGDTRAGYSETRPAPPRDG